jgi:DNA-directed RNA polymerase omega subunit
MARFDRDKTIPKAGGQFELIKMATHRAREIQNGSETKISEKYHSPAVSALKEIQEDLYTRAQYDNRHLEEFFEHES